MNILIANPGSTSYKCKLYEVPGMRVLFQASVERIGDAQGGYTFSFSSGEQHASTLPGPDYTTAVNLTLETIAERYPVGEVAASLTAS